MSRLFYSLALIGGTATSSVSTASAQPAPQTTAAVCAASTAFRSTFAQSVVVPGLRALVDLGLGIVGARIGIPLSLPAARAPAPAPDNCPAPTPTPGPTAANATLIYNLYRVDAQRRVTVATAADRYTTGEGVALSVTNNVPGMLDVFNVDGRGVRTRLETVRLDTPKTTILPAQVQGFYQFDNAAGSETLRLRFYPCNPTLGAGANESLTIAPAPDISRQIAGLGDLRADVRSALITCPAYAQREAAASSAGANESLTVTANQSVAATVRAADATSPLSGLQPIFVTITLQRAPN